MKIDDQPPEVTPFETYKEALHLYERASGNWTGVYLCKVVHGPKDECGYDEPCLEKYHDGLEGVV